MKKALLLLTLFVISVCSNAQTEKRLALVVGNSEYGKGNYLANPVHDAEDISAKLQQLGFETITLLDGTRRDMRDAISFFAEQAKSYDIALFYYAGHGIQTNGENYLVPVDAILEKEEDIEFDCTPMNLLLRKLDASRCPMKIIILDACRNNPFERNWFRSTRSSGLSFVDAPTGTLISYATSPGRTADDGIGRNSPYTSAFLETLDLPQKNILDFFNVVGTKVQTSTNNKQTPWVTNSAINGNFCFNTKKAEYNDFSTVRYQFVINKTLQLVEQGNSYSAVRILLETLPNISPNTSSQIPPEIESAFRKAAAGVNVIHGRDGKIQFATYSPDSKQILSIASSSKISWILVTVRDALSGTILKEFYIPNGCNSICYSPDGNLIAIPDSENNLAIIDAKTFQLKNTLKGHAERIFTIAYSPIGDNIASSADDGGTILIRRAKDGRIIHELKDHTQSVYLIKYSHDSKHLVSASFDGTIKVWDSNTGECINTIPLTESKPVSYFDFPVTTFDISPDGKDIYISMERGYSCVLDIYSRKVVFSLDTGSVTSAAYSPNGNYIAAVKRDKLLIICTKYGEIVVEKTLGEKTTELTSVAFNADGNQIITADNNGNILTFDFNEKTIIAPKSIKDISFNPEGNLMVNSSYYQTRDSTIRIWDLESGELYKTMNGHHGFIAWAEFSPDGKYIVSNSQGSLNDCSIRLWKVESGRLVKKFKGHEKPASFSTFSPDGKYIFSLSEQDSTVLFWEVNSRKETKRFNISPHIYDAIYSPDRQFIVTTDRDRKSATIWTTKDGIATQSITSVNSPISSMAFNPQSSVLYVAVEDGTISKWNTKDVKNNGVVKNTKEPIESIDISPDGKQLLYAYVLKDKCCADIIDIESGIIIQTFEIRFSGVTPQAKFNPNGKQIVVTCNGYDYGIIHIYDYLPLQELINQTSKRFKDHPLTPEERAIYHLE